MLGLTYDDGGWVRKMIEITAEEYDRYVKLRGRAMDEQFFADHGEPWMRAYGTNIDDILKDAKSNKYYIIIKHRLSCD